MDRGISIIRRLRARLSPKSEEGSLLIEVLIGAVLVTSIAGAVLTGLAGAEDTGSRNKARTESAALAQQDQERMRAMAVDDLSNYHASRSVDVAGAPYTVVSDSEWVRDSSGVVSCTNDASQAQYMKITTTVNSTLNQDTPLRQTSLVSPPRGTFSVTSGTAAVQVVDRDQLPLENVRVDMSGPQTLSDVTNSLGCVVFGFIPEGPWSLQISSLGLVGWDGTSPYASDVGVVGGATVLKKIELDQPSSITTAFDTKVGNAAPVAARSKNKSVSNSKLPSPGAKVYSVSSPALTITANSLFPFADGYGVYAGGCVANNPTLYDNDYFSTVGTASFVVTNPGAGSNVTARMPAIDLTATNAAGTALQNARVFVTAADTPCANTFAMQLTNVSGKLPEPGFPFGKYTVCVDDNNKHKVSATIVNTDPAGVTPPIATFKVPTGSPQTSNCAP
jgi:type II secretory pathway pseudopilin PulG